MTTAARIAIEYSRDLLRHLEEFFLRATGNSATDFSTVDAFRDTVHTRASELAHRGEAAFRWLDTEIRPFYSSRGGDAFEAAKQLGGMRLVLGGSSRFLQSQLDSVSTAVLYSDTVFIPDPVMPWLERNRAEERFQHVLLLQAVHTLLQLKPLVDANLRYPPVVVFPSWEKLLEDHDSQTQMGITRLLTDVLSSSLGEKLMGFEEVVEFVDRHPEKFCEAVDRQRLFVAPGGATTEPLQEALIRYERELQTSRSAEWLETYSRSPVHRRVLNGLSERITPMYHLIENAQEFTGHPLMCLEQHAHYFGLVCNASSARLQELGLLDTRTTALIRALGSRRLRWLGGIPASTLARLRLENENVVFRERLTTCIGRLHESALTNMDAVASEVCHDIEAAIAEHEKELRAIQEKYNRTHGQTAVLAIAGAVGALMPALAPLLGSAVPLAVAAKYGHEKIAELTEKRSLTQSMIGVLATTKREI